jgi:hypothetical protein
MEPMHVRRAEAGTAPGTVPRACGSGERADATGQAPRRSREAIRL